MVFSGSEEDPGPYAEDHSLLDTPGKLTWYGWTKNRAERLVIEAGGTVVRLIYPVRVAHLKPDYLRKPLKLYKEGKLYPLFDDQQVSMTFIDELAVVLDKIINKRFSKVTPSNSPLKRGRITQVSHNAPIYHVSTPDTFSPYELVKYALAKLGEDSSKLKSVSIKKFLKSQDNPARYSVKGGLKVEQTEKELGVKFLEWREVVNELVRKGLDIKNLP